MDRALELGPLLSLDVSVDYPNRAEVLRNFRMTIHRGEIAGLIGPSGSGKSTLALAILRLAELRGARVRGSIVFDGRDLLQLAEPALRQIRGKHIGLVFQSPMSALNPALRIETQLREVWRAHSRDSWREARDGGIDLLARMGLPAGREFLRRYPRELSAGQAQRVAIAMAVLHRPQLLIADEPTSALDPASRAGILDIFERLNSELGASILYISHDLASVQRLCHTVAELAPSEPPATDGLSSLYRMLGCSPPGSGRSSSCCTSPASSTTSIAPPSPSAQSTSSGSSDLTTISSGSSFPPSSSPTPPASSS